MTDRRTALLQAYDHAAGVVSGVQPGQLSLPTPCARMDVSALVDHLVGAGFRAAAMGRGETASPDDEFPHVELADAPGELQRGRKEAESAWADEARLSAGVTMPWGEVFSGTTVVDMYLTELAAHTWDLALATGQLDRLDPGLAVTALEGAREMLKPEYRNLVEEGSPFGAEVEAPADATEWERLAAFTGRPPRPTAA